MTPLLPSGEELPPPFAGRLLGRPAGRRYGQQAQQEERLCRFTEQGHASEPQFNSEEQDGLDSRRPCGVVSVSGGPVKLMIKRSLLPAPAGSLNFCNKPGFFLR
jgi:hypothetical protein